LEEPAALDADTDQLLAYAASNDPDVMYYHEAMQQPDRQAFQEAMIEEIEAHTNANNLILVPRRDVPEGASILKAVWQMKRKRRIATGEVYKYKARLCIDGSRQTKGVNYWETFAPVARWSTIRTVMTLMVANR